VQIIIKKTRKEVPTSSERQELKKFLYSILRESSTSITILGDTARLVPSLLIIRNFEIVAEASPPRN
jgi:hypothetical protein